MTDRHPQWIADRTNPSPSFGSSCSTPVSSERSMAPEYSDSSSCAALIDVHADSSSGEDSDSSSSEDDQ